MTDVTLSKVRDLMIIGAVALAVIIGAIVGVAHLTASHPSAQVLACQAQQDGLNKFLADRHMRAVPKGEQRIGVRECITSGTLP